MSDKKRGLLKKHLLARYPHFDDAGFVRDLDEVVISQPELARWFEVTNQAISYWKRQGLLEYAGIKKETGTVESEEYENGWYYFKKALAWHRANIGKEDLPEMGDQNFLDSLPPEIQTAYLESSKDPLDKMKDVKEVLKRDLALKQSRGELIEADKLDEAMAELIAIQIGHYKNDLKTLPSKLGLNQKVSKILDKHYEKRIKSLQKQFKKRSNAKIIDVIDRVQELIDSEGVDELMERLK